MDSFISTTSENSQRSRNTSHNSSILNTNTFENSKYNKKDYQLESNENSKIYIFQNNLFIKELLLININKEQKVKVFCTL